MKQEVEPSSNRIYTELYITEGQSEEVNTQHEVRQLETASKKKETLHDTPIKCHDIFKALPDQQRHIRVVLTNGVAGVGKNLLSAEVHSGSGQRARRKPRCQSGGSALVQGAEPDQDERFSLLRLLHVFPSNITEGVISQRAVDKPHQGEAASLGSHLDNFQTLQQPIRSLFTGWTGVVTEVRGFTDAQKEEYFRRRVSDEDLSSRIISHIKPSRSLHIMCLIPVFCWITATVLDHMLTTDQRGELPKT
ncbi:hypothetical protein GBF38_002816 [Nibea albiflora]|uniref:Uncharacterized protein n=1 Tax=Nibea albiflora TaxID=240163 RepID=A0ACB7EE99_NIBAL|nr:hypothetical protein GBF38_002816 [Nibea albiflora]